MWLNLCTKFVLYTVYVQFWINFCSLLFKQSNRWRPFVANVWLPCLVRSSLNKSRMTDISGRWRVFSYQQIFPVLVFIHIQVLSFFFLARCQQKVSWCYRALSKESSTLSKFSEQNMPDRKTTPYKRTSRYLLGGHQCLRCSGGRLLDSVESLPSQYNSSSTAFTQKSILMKLSPLALS